MNDKLKQYLVPATLAGTALSAFPAFAADGATTPVSASDWSAILTSLTAQ